MSGLKPSAALYINVGVSAEMFAKLCQHVETEIHNDLVERTTRFNAARARPRTSELLRYSPWAKSEDGSKRHMALMRQGVLNGTPAYYREMAELYETYKRELKAAAHAYSGPIPTKVPSPITFQVALARVLARLMETLPIPLCPAKLKAVKPAVSGVVA